VKTVNTVIQTFSSMVMVCCQTSSNGGNKEELGGDPTVRPWLIFWTRDQSWKM